MADGLARIPIHNRMLRMGQTVYWMNVSLDLLIESRTNEGGDGSWMRISDSLHRVFNERAREISLAIEGRVIYETMESFWPAARNDTSLPETLQEYGHIWTDTPKILVSNTRATAKYNTRIVGGSTAIEELAELRRTTDGVIGVGGANVATQMLNRGLLDELMLFTHPIVLGSGRPLFDNVKHPVDCDLVEQAAFDDGVTLHRYSIRGATPVQ